MKLPTYRRIITQDFPEENHELVEQIGSNINDGFNTVYGALTKRLTFGDNMAASVKTVDVTVDSNGNPTTRTSVSLDVQNTPVIGCIIISAQNLSNSNTYPTSAPFLSYAQDGNLLRINNITGLQAGNSYRITLIAIN